jgi:hypothetical protein
MGFKVVAQQRRRIRSSKTCKAAASEAVQLLESRVLMSSTLGWTFGTTTSSTPVLHNSGTPVGFTEAGFGIGDSFGTVSTYVNASSASSGYTGASGGENIGNAVAVSGNSTINPSTSAYYTVTLTPASGDKIELDGLSFGMRSTSTGPQKLSVRSSIDGFASDLATDTITNNSVWSLHTESLTTATGAANTPVELRIYLYGGTGNAGSGTENNRMDDVSLTATAVAEITTPTVTGISPTVGTTAGGTVVTINGTSFTDTSTVAFNGAAGSNVTYVSPTQLTAVSPAGTGTVDVTVSNGVGTSPTSSADQFTFVAVPVYSFDSANVYSVAENAGNEVITVDRGTNTDSAGTVDFTIGASGDSAVAGTNYGSTVTVSSGTVNGDSGTLNFASGDTTQTITIPLIAASPQGGNKTATVTLANASGGALITSPASEVVTIVDTPLENINFDSANYSVDESAGTASFTIDRQFSGGATSATSNVVFTTSDGVPYTYGSAQTPQDAQAGRDYTTTTQTVTFTGTQTSQTVTVPLIDVQTFAGTRYFTAALSSPSEATLTGTETATEAINDDTVTAPNGTDTPMAASSYTAGVETSGPYYVNSYLDLVSTPTGSLGYSSFPEIEFPAPTGYVIGKVDSVTLSLDNLGTGGYAGTAGSFDVYSLTDDTVPASSLQYSSSGATGPAVIGTQASPVLLGTAYFPNNGNIYNDFTLDNIPAAASSAIAAEQHAGLPIRFAIVPHSGSPVTVEWEGNHSGSPVPNLTLLVEKSAVAQEPVSFSMSNYTVSETDGAATITLTRGGTDNADTLTVDYATSDGSALAGTNYTTTTGTATFAANSTTTSFTVPVNSVTNQNGDKFLNLTLSNPMVDGTQSTVGVLGSQSTATLTISDPSAATSETLSPGLYNAADVETAGIYDSSEFKATAKGGTKAPYASFGVLDLTAPTPSLPVTAIDSVTLSGTANGPEAPAAGLLHFYLVSDNTSSIDPTTPESTVNGFYDASQGVEGLGSQFGTTYLLGSYFFSGTANQITIPLGYSSDAETQLISALNNPGSDIRIVVTAEDTNVVADFTPISMSLMIGVHESANVTTTPAWLSPGPAATFTFNKTNETLELSSGTATVIDDPSKSTYGDGSVAITVDGGAALSFSPASGSTVAIGSLTLASNAMASLSPTASVLLSTSTLSISSNSTLDIGNGLVDVTSGSLSTINGYAASGYNNGQWNGVTGVVSSVAASDSTHLTAVAVVQNNQGGSPVLTSFGTGFTVTPGASDILIRYTYYGDADLSGVVDGSDYSRIDNANLAHATGWFNGDFNYDATLNGSDYTLIDNAYNTQSASIPLAQVVGNRAAVAARNAAVTVPSGSTTPTDSFFSDKKLKTSLFSQLEELISSPQQI